MKQIFFHNRQLKLSVTPPLQSLKLFQRFAFFIVFFFPQTFFGQTVAAKYSPSADGWNKADAHKNCKSCHQTHEENPSSGYYGKTNPDILKNNYNTTKIPQMGVGWSSLMIMNYPLCFQCHEISSVGDTHRKMKDGHFLKYTGCNVCHDPHDYQGTAASNKYLKFDLSVIQPNPVNGKIIDLNERKCFMQCHDPNGIVNYLHKSSGSEF